MRDERAKKTESTVLITLFVFIALLFTFAIIVIFNDIQTLYFLIKPIGVVSIITSIVIFVLAERHNKKHRKS